MRLYYPYARWRKLRSFIACRRPEMFVGRDLSWGDAIVVSSVSSRSVRSLATIVVLRCLSSLDDDRSLSLVVRQSLVCRRARVVIVRTLAGGDCVPSLLLVVKGRSLVVSHRVVMRS